MADTSSSVDSPPAIHSTPTATAMTDSSPPNTTNTSAPQPPFSPSSQAPPPPPLTVGIAEDMNRRFRRSMEDSHCAFANDYGAVGSQQSFFGVFDGHAGKQAADWCGEQLHQHFLALLQQHPSDTPIPPLLDQLFTSTDEHLSDRQGIHSGCTAAIAFLRTEGRVGRRLYTANVGDARVVLCRDGRAVRLSHDHKGSDPQEMKRIVDQGGFIMHHRVNGVLAVTRALGDGSMKDLVVSHPFTTETTLRPTDTRLILACDGVWDVLQDQQAVDLVREIGDPQQAANLLLRQALQLGSMDNITCMVINLS